MPKVIISCSEICSSGSVVVILRILLKVLLVPTLVYSEKCQVQCLPYHTHEEWFTPALTHKSCYMKYVHMHCWSWATLVQPTTWWSPVPFRASFIIAVQSCAACVRTLSPYVPSSSQTVSQRAVGVWSDPFWCSLLNILVLY